MSAPSTPSSVAEGLGLSATRAAVDLLGASSTSTGAGGRAGAPSSGVRLLLHKLVGLEEKLERVLAGHRKHSKLLRGAAKQSDLESLRRDAARTTELEALAQAVVGRSEVVRMVGEAENKALDEVATTNRRVVALEEHIRGA